jgi:asparagine synthase (glutamine-hydrolysing)
VLPEHTSRFPKRGLDIDRITRIYDEHVNGSRDHTNFLWAVYVFGRWHNNMQERGVLA